MAPEYVMQGQFFVKSDIFSFGVLVLEIVSGQKNTGFRNREDVEDLISFVSLFFTHSFHCYSYLSFELYAKPVQMKLHKV